MNWNRHYDLEGKHATFSPSSPAWIRYDDNKLITAYSKKKNATMGSRIHAWAKETIDLGFKQPDIRKTVYMYINDAIGFGMDTEVVLYHSQHFFGTADTICFRNKFLRIHDLKTGDSKPTMEQLLCYAALFCLEYRINPFDIETELRIYQSNDIQICRPSPQDIKTTMDIIVHHNNTLKKCDTEEG